MNILLFTDANVFAGTERHMLDLACALSRLGAGVRIGCPRPGALAERAAKAGISVLPIPKKGHIDRHAISVLASLLTSNQVDLVHAHNGRTHIAAAFAVKKAGRGICVATQHFLRPARIDRIGPKAIVARLLHKRAARSTSHTIAISDAVRHAAIARGEVRPDAITTVHNGIEPPDLTQAPDSNTIRRAFKLTADTPLIFCAARLQAEKDIPTLITAMQAVAAAHRAAHCLIAGEGDLHGELQKQIDSLGLSSAVTLMGFRPDIPALLRACDLFVLPSIAEPFGLVLLEAMALGKPVIATHAGGPREIVAPGETGLLVPPSNPAALAAAINQLLAQPNLRLAFGQAGLAHYRAHFTSDRMAAQTLAIYRRASSTTVPVEQTQPLALAASQ